MYEAGEDDNNASLPAFGIEKPEIRKIREK